MSKNTWTSVRLLKPLNDLIDKKVKLLNRNGYATKTAFVNQVVGKELDKLMGVRCKNEINN